MIDGLIAGRIYGKPTERTSKTGKPFVVAKVRAATGDGESMFVNVIAFDTAPCTALLALADGDSVALTGSLTPKTWTDKEGNTRPALDVVAHQVLTSYSVTKKRSAMHPPPAPAPAHGRAKDEAWQARAPRDRSGPGDFEPLDF
jgi:single-stranded DNA-binding protein